MPKVPKELIKAASSAIILNFKPQRGHSTPQNRRPPRRRNDGNHFANRQENIVSTHSEISGRNINQNVSDAIRRGNRDTRRGFHRHGAHHRGGHRGGGHRAAVHRGDANFGGSIVRDANADRPNSGRANGRNPNANDLSGSGWNGADPNAGDSNNVIPNAGGARVPTTRDFKYKILRLQKRLKKLERQQQAHEQSKHPSPDTHTGKDQKDDTEQTSEEDTEMISHEHSDTEQNSTDQPNNE